MTPLTPTRGASEMGAWLDQSCRLAAPSPRVARTGDLAGDLAGADAGRDIMPMAISGETMDSAHNIYSQPLYARPVAAARPAATDQKALRECDCPPWVIRCAHFDNTTLAIGDIELAKEPGMIVIGRRFAVVEPDRPLGNYHAYKPIFQSNDLAAAHAAFSRAEELLRGVVVS